MELKTRVVALALLAVLFGILGGVLVMVSQKGRHHSTGLAVFGALLVVLPIAFAFLSARRRLIIDERRIVAKGFFGTTVIPWDDVDHYRYWSLGQQGVYVAGGGGLAGVLIVAVAFAVAKAVRKAPGNRQFSLGGMVLVGKDGQKIKLAQHYKGVAGALDRCFDELHGRLRERPRDYAPLAVTAAEVIHDKKGPLALAEIEKVSVTGGRITLRKRGKRLAWANVSMRSMKNAMLFVDDLAERGIVIDAQDEVFVPVPVLAKLRAAASRQSAMPVAKVVQR